MTSTDVNRPDVVDDIDWVDIPAGLLHRGTPAEQAAAEAREHADAGVEPQWFDKEAPRAVVEVAAFTIARTPVTWAQWTPFARDAGLPVRTDVIDDHPADDLTWAQATAYCDWLGESLDATVSLPSELQWERAARGDLPRRYPWGDEWDKRCANTAELGVGHTLPVGTLMRGTSQFGVLDLAGNVDEWTADLYRPYAGAPAGVPETEEWAVDPHVTRGGAYHHCRDLARCARRHAVYPGVIGAGLRVCLG